MYLLRVLRSGHGSVSITSIYLSIRRKIKRPLFFPILFSLSFDVLHRIPECWNLIFLLFLLCLFLGHRLSARTLHLIPRILRYPTSSMTQRTRNGHHFRGIFVSRPAIRWSLQRTGSFRVTAHGAWNGFKRHLLVLQQWTHQTNYLRFSHYTILDLK